MTAAIAIIFDHEKKILLVQREDVPVWVLPGGGVDANESPDIATIRECKEETGLEVKIIRKVAEYHPINRLSQTTHTFECEVIGGSLKAGEECRAAKYFNLNELPGELFFIHRDWIEDALQNHPEVIKKPLDKVTYLALLKYFCYRPWQVLRYLFTRLSLRS